MSNFSFIECLSMREGFKSPLLTPIYIHKSDILYSAIGNFVLNYLYLFTFCTVVFTASTFKVVFVRSTLKFGCELIYFNINTQNRSPRTVSVANRFECIYGKNQLHFRFRPFIRFGDTRLGFCFERNRFFFSAKPARPMRVGHIV